MNEKQTFPILNDVGVKAFPHLPLTNGMLVMWRDAQGRYNSTNEMHSCFVFDKQNCFFFLPLTNNMIDYVEDSRHLNEPILLLQCGDFEFSQPEPEKCRGFPIQFNPRRNHGYKGMIWGLESFGDVYGCPPGGNYLQARARYLTALQRSARMHIPLEVYVGNGRCEVVDPRTAGLTLQDHPLGSHFAL